MNAAERLEELNKLASEAGKLERDAQNAVRVADEMAKRRREWEEKGGADAVGLDAPAAIKIRGAYRSWIEHELEGALEKAFGDNLPRLMRVAELQVRAKAKQLRAAADLVRETIRAALVEG